MKRHIDGTPKGQFLNILFKAEKNKNVVGRSVAQCVNQTNRKLDIFTLKK